MSDKGLRRSRVARVSSSTFVKVGYALALADLRGDYDAANVLRDSLAVLRVAAPSSVNVSECLARGRAVAVVAEWRASRGCASAEKRQSDGPMGWLVADTSTDDGQGGAS